MDCKLATRVIAVENAQHTVKLYNEISKRSSEMIEKMDQMHRLSPKINNTKFFAKKVKKCSDTVVENSIRRCAAAQHAMETDSDVFVKFLACDNTSIMTPLAVFQSVINRVVKQAEDDVREDISDMEEFTKVYNEVVDYMNSAESDVLSVNEKVIVNEVV